MSGLKALELLRDLTAGAIHSFELNKIKGRTRFILFDLCRKLWKDAHVFWNLFSVGKCFNSV